MTDWRNQAGERLRGVLLQHTDAKRAEKAVYHLLRAIESYRQARPIVDQDGRHREAFTLASTKTKVKQLRALAAAGDFEAAIAGIRDPEVLLHIARSHDGPIGSVTTKTVGRLLREVEKILFDQSHRGRPDDFHRDALAHDVALVVRDVLGTEPKARAGRGTCTYHEVLRVTFEEAKIFVSDILPWAEAGMALLADDSIPHNLLI